MAALTIFEILARQRAELAKRNQKLAAQLVKDYQHAFRVIERESDKLLNKIRDAREAGQSVSPGWLLQQSRLKTLETQIRREIDKYGAIAFERIVEEQKRLLERGASGAISLAEAAMGKPPAGISASFARLPTEVIETLSGLFDEDSPLRRLMDGLGPEAATNARRIFITGLAQGSSVQKIASGLRQSLGITKTRALTVARTETLRAYREATHQTYKLNSDTVRGWIWHSALGPRTCAACYGMHGSKHSINERLDDHCNGRCTPVPITASWADMGFVGIPDTRPQIESGESVFARLTAVQQTQILGSPKAYQAYRDGTLTLRDFVGRRTSKDWGSMRYQLSLSKALERKRRRAA